MKVWCPWGMTPRLPSERSTWTMPARSMAMRPLSMLTIIGRASLSGITGSQMHFHFGIFCSKVREPNASVSMYVLSPTTCVSSTFATKPDSPINSDMCMWRCRLVLRVGHRSKPTRNPGFDFSSAVPVKSRPNDRGYGLALITTDWGTKSCTQRAGNCTVPTSGAAASTTRAAISSNCSASATSGLARANSPAGAALGKSTAPLGDWNSMNCAACSWTCSAAGAGRPLAGKPLAGRLPGMLLAGKMLGWEMLPGKPLDGAVLAGKLLGGELPAGAPVAGALLAGKLLPGASKPPR
mmetsp:Transcript_49683/g.142974  ORF Transcript_49683/g.142974 Transcript_49683/m.142974 type:complete len:295 (+) Transcript_49683:695-1579(+)